MVLTHRRRSLALLAALVAVIGLLIVQARPASAATVTFNGVKLNQYVPNQYPLVALVDHTSQNPNWFHVRDSAFPAWRTPLNGTIGGHPEFVVTDDCSLYPNRVCWEIVERNMSVGGVVDNCDWSAGASPTLIGATCQEGPGRVVIIMASNHHGDSSAVRVAATTHEIGHGYGLGHSTDSSYLMYPTTDGNPSVPRGDESGCVYQVYNFPPCSSDNTPNVAQRQASPGGPYIAVPDYVK